MYIEDALIIKSNLKCKPGSALVVLRETDSLVYIVFGSVSLLINGNNSFSYRTVRD